MGSSLITDLAIANALHEAETMSTKVMFSSRIAYDRRVRGVLKRGSLAHLFLLKLETKVLRTV